MKSYPNEVETRRGIDEMLEIEDKYEKHNHDESEVGEIAHLRAISLKKDDSQMSGDDGDVYMSAISDLLLCNELRSDLIKASLVDYAFEGKRMKKKKKRTTAPRIPAWSPTVVLTGQHSG